jgi:predicted nuclease of predicted toxin-antitoxin system
MASFYADENFNQKVIPYMASLGHDVLSAQQAGQAGKKKTDAEVLAFATILSRAVLTHNRPDFVKLHKKAGPHAGVLVCTNDRDYAALAQRIHDAVASKASLHDNLVRVNKPSKATP